jgi:hypothetical protein
MYSMVAMTAPQARVFRAPPSKYGGVRAEGQDLAPSNEGDNP